MKQKGFGVIEWFLVLLLVFIATGWCVNLYKLTQLNFEAPYKAEAIRLAGLIPPVGAIVAWIDIDDGPTE